METFFKNMSAEEGTKEKLAQDLMTLVHDAEELVRATGGDLADKSKEELIAAITRLKSTCRRLEHEAVQRSKAADTLIREHPYEAIGIGFGIGLLLGVLTRRR